MQPSTLRLSTLLAAALPLLMPAVATAQAPGPDIEAGRARAAAVCSACHGQNGISVSDSIPNLAGQKSGYLVAQLNALKSGTRKNAIMNAMAAQLSASDIVNVAAHFASLSGAMQAAAKSDLLPNLAKTQATLPEGYPAGFTMYQTVNRTDLNQVRYLYANAVAIDAARAGRALPDGSVLVLEQHAAKLGDDKKPVTGADGYNVKDRLLAYSIMGRQAGWGNEIPEMLRNEDWNYALLTADKKPRAGVNQAECLACHKPLDKMSYAFSIEPLKQAALKAR
jgi:cytochrome c553